MIKLGLAQLASSSDARENAEAVIAFAAEAKAQGCAAVCFPEANLTGYFPGEAPNLALSRDNAVLLRISAAAREINIDLMPGFMERDGNRFHLTHGIFRGDGSADYYRKTHLGQKEQQFFAPGNALEVFSLSCGLRAGFQLCVETHFPDITQTLSLIGAQVIFAPHAVPSAAGSRREIWQKYIPARSYDNRVYFACCNQWDGVRFGGGCYVTAPQGEAVLARFEDHPDLAVFPVDPEAVCSYHAGNPSARYRYFPDHRRPDLYL